MIQHALHDGVRHLRVGIEERQADHIALQTDVDQHVGRERLQRLAHLGLRIVPIGGDLRVDTRQANRGDRRARQIGTAEDIRIGIDDLPPLV